jgi:hypothetical protein
MNKDCNKHLTKCGLKELVTVLRREADDDVCAHTEEWWTDHMETAIADGDAPDWDGDLVMTVR